jgi:FkbM family methyltransferase
VKQYAFAVLKKTSSVLRPFETALSRVPGVPFLYRKLYGVMKPTGTVKLQLADLQLWADAADEGVTRPILLHGTFEEAETALVRRVLHPGMTVIDIGANIGYYSVLASRIVGDSGHVFAIEPEPKNRALLAKNAAENACKNISISALAISSRGGTARLYTDRSNFGNPSLEARNIIDRASSIEVTTTTLDDFVTREVREPVDFIKMDVQGAEGLVLAGAEHVLSQPGVALLMEFWPKGLRNSASNPLSVLRVLEQRGFALQIVESRGVSQPATATQILERTERSKDRFVNLFCIKAADG